MDASESGGGISRRRMLKRIGAGAAVAWSAPVLTSLRTPAFAQASPTCAPGSFCLSCGDPCPGETPTCGGEGVCGDPLWCGCVTSLEGTNACLANVYGARGCSSTSECLENEVCVPICGLDCDPRSAWCIPRCGTGSKAPRGARRPTSKA
jgi:hypothetical protein